MSHIGGTRENVVDDLADAFAQEVDGSIRDHRTSITEVIDATFHEQERLFNLATRRWPAPMRRLFIQKLVALQAGVMELAKTALAPWEDETCPSCPKETKRTKATIRGER